jgi:hypothetical protein
MLAKTPLVNQFYNFVASKDPDQEYDYYSSSNCACGQFISEVMGVEPSESTGTEWMLAWDQMYKPVGKDDEGPLGLNTIARGGCPDRKTWTFGALRKRLEKYAPECVG